MPLRLSGTCEPVAGPAVIYGLIDPFSDELFYVGVTTKPRFRRLGSHVHDARQLNMTGDRCHRIRSILNSGGRPHIFDIEHVPIERWAEAEEFWIAYFRFIGAALTNRAIGGPGANGARQSSATKLRRRAAAVGRDMSHTHTPAVRELAAQKMRRPIEINGVRYSGILPAAQALGTSKGMIIYWLDTGRAKRLTGPKAGFSNKLRGRARGKRHPKSRPLVVDGVVYAALHEAARERNVWVSTVMRWLKSGRARYVSSSPSEIQ